MHKIIVALISLLAGNHNKTTAKLVGDFPNALQIPKAKTIQASLSFADLIGESISMCECHGFAGQAGE